MSIVSASCRSCGRTGLELVLSLGEMPLANALLIEAELDLPEPTYPLDLASLAIDIDLPEDLLSIQQWHR